MNLCREVMNKEGENWQISKERREDERRQLVEKHERLGTARTKKEAVRTKQKCKEIQSKITTELKKLPRNRQILMEKEMERKRILLLREAKQELWKKWRQRKGRGQVPKIAKLKEQEKESLTRELEKIEAQVEKYKEGWKKSRKERNLKNLRNGTP